MTYRALVDFFASCEDFPIPIGEVFAWIRENTDHKIISLHEVARDKKAFRGAFRRVGIPKGAMYSGEYDIVAKILYGADLDLEWKRLVICKEALHVFDSPGSRVNTPEAVEKLILAVIASELRGAPFMPAINDHLGAFRAMAVLIPEAARRKLAKALTDDSRTIAEIARFVALPDAYVDIWLRAGDQISDGLFNI